MKRNLLSLAIGAAVALPSVALAEPTVYGRADLSYALVDIDGAEGGWELSSNSSRLGFKGDSDLDGGLKAIYKMEFGVGITDGGGISDRNQYVGLASDSFGELLLGRIDTPLKQSQGKVDLFGDHGADITVLMDGEERRSDTIAYISPKIAEAVTVKLSLYPGEEINAPEGSDADNGMADGTSLAVEFSQDGIYAALAIDSEIGGYNSLGTGDATRLVGQYKTDDFVVGGIYQMAEQSEGDDEETSLIIEGGFNIESVFLKVAYGTSTYDNGTTETDETLLALGAEFKLAKTTKTYAEYISYEDEGTDDEVSAIVAGIQHNF